MMGNMIREGLMMSRDLKATLWNHRDQGREE